jgi:hypothetical protein
MKHSVHSHSTHAQPSSSRTVIFMAVRAAASLGGVLAVTLVALSSTAAQADTGLEPGVHVDPGSPAAKEYVIPLGQARQIGAGGSSDGSSPPLFGAGIGPRGPGGSSHSHSGAGRTSGAANASGSGSASKPSSTGIAGRESLPSSVLASSSRASGDSGSLLALLAGGVAILILGGLGGAMLRRSRHLTVPGTIGKR